MIDTMLIVSIPLALVLGGVLLLWVHHLSLGWRGTSNSGGRLPKGSYGWPIVGETLAFARNPALYGSSRVKRYGQIFKSSLFLQPAIVGTSPEFAKFVINNSTLFVSGYPANFTNVLGLKAFIFRDGPPHMSIKKLLQQSILPEGLRTKVHVLESIILQHLASWEQRGTVVGVDATRKITFDISMWLLVGVRDIGSTAEGRKVLKNFEAFSKTLLSVPVNIPGTIYNKGLKAKAGVTSYLKSILEQRKGRQNGHSDMLGALLAGRDDDQEHDEVKNLDDDLIADNLVFMWFASYDTTSTELAWILKFIVDHPDVFQRLQAEQREILKTKDPSLEGPRLTWEDTRKMVYAQQFLQEVLRVLTIIPFVPRKATEDAEYNGYIIPKGWLVMTLFNTIHSDPAIFSDPTSFKPDRFNVAPKSNTYLPFSTGSHVCAGRELSKLVALIFIHHLTTTYTYESLAPDRGIVYSSFPTIVGGYPINVRRRD